MINKLSLSGVLMDVTVQNITSNGKGAQFGVVTVAGTTYAVRRNVTLDTPWTVVTRVGGRK